MRPLPFLLYMAVLLYGAYATDYCDPELCKDEGEHIGCDNDGEFDESCEEAETIEVDDHLKDVLLDYHNVKRNMIAGGEVANHDPACRMATSQWDEELAYLAGLNVLQCEMKHDGCRNTDDFLASGQNLAYVSYDENEAIEDTLQLLVNMWYDEVENSSMAIIDSYPEEDDFAEFGHFTALVNDQQVRIGCALSRYLAPSGDHKRVLLACNYARTNIDLEPVYVACDTPAEKCTTGTNPNYPNLCSVDEDIDPNDYENDDYDDDDGDYYEDEEDEDEYDD